MRLASSKLSELSPILILFHLCFLPSCLLEISFENPALGAGCINSWLPLLTTWSPVQVSQLLLKCALQDIAAMSLRAEGPEVNCESR